MSEMPNTIIPEITVNSKSTHSSSLRRTSNNQRNQLLLAFVGITVLTICFIYSLKADQVLLTNKISAYIIFAAWIFMKTNDPAKSGSRRRD